MLAFTDDGFSYIAEVSNYAHVYFHMLYSVYHVNITMLIICIKDDWMMLCYF